ncbi:MAG: NnrU family protein [Burkholderiales bacterium]|nr:NnrU family protein [Burkholderiales bacterium]
MTLLILGLVLFLGVHSVSIVAPAWRDAQLAQRGEAAWKGFYSVAAGIGLALTIYGYGVARDAPIVLYLPLPGLRHVALLLLLPVFVLLLAVYLPGRIKTATKHPMLLATKLWAAAHLLANGTLADVLLFGGFLAWAIADRISLNRRPAHAVPALPARAANDAIALAGGLVLYAVTLLWLHAWLIGVAPIS